MPHCRRWGAAEEACRTNSCFSSEELGRNRWLLLRVAGLETIGVGDADIGGKAQAHDAFERGRIIGQREGFGGLSGIAFGDQKVCAEVHAALPERAKEGTANFLVGHARETIAQRSTMCTPRRVEITKLNEVGAFENCQMGDNRGSCVKNLQRFFVMRSAPEKVRRGGKRL